MPEFHWLTSLDIYKRIHHFPIQITICLVLNGAPTRTLKLLLDSTALKYTSSFLSPSYISETFPEYTDENAIGKLK